jgi:predicted RNA-binding protein associated with RNAse of E/G family
MAHAETPVHRPKTEVFDLAAMTNTDPKGFVRRVEEYRAEPWGLYMARSSDHAKFHYLESWLLPELGLRASIFHFVPEHARDQDYYLDVGVFRSGETRWTSVDHYLDIVIRAGRDAELIDVDELFDARAAGLVTTEEATRAVDNAVRAIDGLARHEYDLGAWLDSLAMPISWR